MSNALKNIGFSEGKKKKKRIGKKRFPSLVNKKKVLLFPYQRVHPHDRLQKYAEKKTNVLKITD
jgi:hypothetical protein